MKRTTQGLALALTVVLLALALGGCGNDDATAPAVDSPTIAADPLDDALKSLGEPAPVGTADRVACLADALGLDEDQVAALTEAYATFRAGMQDLRDQVIAGDLTLEEARAAAMDLREAFEAELQVILTAEQWDLFQELRLGGANHMGPRYRDRDPAARWTEMLLAIGADQDQVADVLAALDVFLTGMEDIRAAVMDGSMTREEARDAAMELRNDFDAALRSILTPEQYAALQELRPDCDGPDGSGGPGDSGGSGGHGGHGGH